MSKAKLRKKYKSIERRKADPFSRYWYSKACALWSKLVKRYSEGKCARCGKSDGVLNSHHLLAKEIHPQYQFCTINGISLCYRCHKMFAHRDAIVFSIWLKTYYPEKYDWCALQYKWISEHIYLTCVDYKAAFESLTIEANSSSSPCPTNVF